ncbi:crossover junction endodeoxyribonuclease RuvC [Allohahella sp. A8]|uniref:crossover junction endodeoxyribonuclease RuvC n=1 Tax=Allohahella sp. A8 TaxID=3141461 RepID=UPI003A80EC0A
MIILGIDPGSRITGYGLVQAQHNKPVYVASGCIRVQGDTLAERLQCVFRSVAQVIEMYRPETAAIEKVFMAKNADSALKLGQARGAAILAMAEAGLEVGEYSATKVKQAMTGTGAATKEQMQHMVQAVLRLDATPQADAADALSIAICHMHTTHSLNVLRTNSERVSSFVRGRLR